MCNQLRYFDDNTQIITRSGQFEIQENCNAVMFTNIGADTVLVNEKTLHPGTVGSILGDSFAIGGNEGEIYKRRTYVVRFSTTVNPMLEVTQKCYVDK
jgi:hypothetical protein